MTKKSVKTDHESDEKKGGNGHPEAGAAEIAQEPAGPVAEEKPVEKEDPKKREADLLDQLQRVAAEFENYRKKNSREYQHGREDGIVTAGETILPALESLSLAVRTADQSHDVSKLIEGVELVRRQLLSRLETLGVKEIEVREGEIMDPGVHEVLWAEPSAEVEPDHILSVVQPGYKLNERLISAAKVKVAKQKRED